MKISNRKLIKRIDCWIVSFHRAIIEKKKKKEKKKVANVHERAWYTLHIFVFTHGLMNWSKKKKKKKKLK